MTIHNLLENVAALSCVVLVFQSQAGSVSQTIVEWQAVDGEWSGAWNDPNHWKGGMPGEKQVGRITPTATTTPMEITFPAGAYSCPAEIRLENDWKDTHSVYLVGTNTTYTISASADGSEIHSALPFATYAINSTILNIVYG